MMFSLPFKWVEHKEKGAKEDEGDDDDDEEVLVGASFKP